MHQIEEKKVITKEQRKEKQPKNVHTRSATFPSHTGEDAKRTIYTHISELWCYLSSLWCNREATLSPTDPPPPTQLNKTGSADKQLLQLDDEAIPYHTTPPFYPLFLPDQKKLIPNEENKQTKKSLNTTATCLNDRTTLQTRHSKKDDRKLQNTPPPLFFSLYVFLFVFVFVLYIFFCFCADLSRKCRSLCSKKQEAG